MLEYVRLIIRLRAVTEVVLPVHAGSTLRGMFKTSLRRVCCPLKGEKCRGCMLRDRCVYALVTENFTETGENTVLPYALACSGARGRYAPGDSLSFSLVIFGKAIDYLPYIIYSLSEWERLNISRFQSFRTQGNGGDSPGPCPADEPPRGRVVLALVEQVMDHETLTLYTPGRPYRTPAPGVMYLRPATGDGNGQFQVRLDFISPVRIFRKIRDAGDSRKKTLVTPELFDFHHFFRSIQTRWFGLTTHFGTASPAETGTGETERPEQALPAVRTAQNHLQLEAIRRCDARNPRWYFYDGFMGSVVFEAVPSGLIPWITAGEVLQVGKFPTMGFGEYRATLMVNH